ncbi:MAG: DUF2164 domain-containing protein [Sideroxydans sp.]|nr:DUF2164 domain-containing protein [Sideroxydans sp.]
MTIEISKEARKDAIESIERYFQENLSEHIEDKLGNVAAGALLDYFLEEIGSVVYNKAIADAQERLQVRVMELDMEIHEDEFQFWRKPGHIHKK